jgi:hypothetical protein
MLQFSVDGFGYQFFLVAEQSVLPDGSETQAAKGIELGGTSHKSREVGRHIGWVNMKRFLKLHGQGIKALGD